MKNLYAGTLSVILVACMPGSVARGDVILLNSGSEIHGTVLKRDEHRIWLDVGPTVLSFSVDDIDEVQLETSEVAEAIETDALFHTARNLPQLSPREQAKRVGPSIIKIATPGGLGSGVIIDEAGHAITNAHVIQGETSLRATVWFPHE